MNHWNLPSNCWITTQINFWFLFNCAKTKNFPLCSLGVLFFLQMFGVWREIYVCLCHAIMVYYVFRKVSKHIRARTFFGRDKGQKSETRTKRTCFTRAFYFSIKFFCIILKKWCCLITLVETLFPFSMLLDLVWLQTDFLNFLIFFFPKAKNLLRRIFSVTLKVYWY